METKVQIVEQVEEPQNLLPKVAEPEPRHRVIYPWILFFGYALFSLAGWVRMIATVVDWHWYVLAGVWPGPLYLAITGGLWGLAGMTAVIWLWLRRPWARTASFIVALFFALTFWGDRLLVVSLNSYGSNDLFAAVLTLLGLIFALRVLRPLNEFRSIFKKCEGNNVEIRTRN